MNAFLLRWRIEQQREDRRRTGRGLQAGDIVIDDRGQFREVVMAASAGECLEAAAEIRAQQARERRAEE